MRVAIGAAALCSALGILVVATTTVAARSYDSQISGFEGPTSVAFDLDGNAWITDGNSGQPFGTGGVYKYNPYPSQTRLFAPNASAAFGSRDFQLAVEQSTGEVFVANNNGRSVLIFDNSGVYTHKWSHLNNIGNDYEGFHIAIDNSDTVSRGRIYLSLTGPENDIEVVDREQRPVDFPATAPYIEENRLTGTPDGRFGSVGSVAVGPDGELFVVDQGTGLVDEFDSSGLFLREFPGRPGVGISVDPITGNVIVGAPGPFANELDAFGNYLGTISEGGGGASLQVNGTPGFNADGYLYAPVSGEGGEGVDIFKPSPPVPMVTYQPVSNPTASTGTLNATVDANGAGTVGGCHFEYGTDTSYGLGELPCQPAAPLSGVTTIKADISGLTKDATYNYRVVLASANGPSYGADQTYTPHQIRGLTTDPATEIGEDSAKLNASFLGSGADTHYYFEWGATPAYGNTSALPPGVDAGSPSGLNRTSLSFDLSGLASYSTYRYRVVATNGTDTSYGEDRNFTTAPGTPVIIKESSTDVHADRAVLNATLIANGADTSYRFEVVDDASYGESGWSDATEVGVPNTGVGRGKNPEDVSTLVGGLQPGTLYHYRAVGTNLAGSGFPASDHTFTTFPFVKEINDPCPNSHVRQQTGAALLADCRAYEVVSAADAGGYDVESSLVPGQVPFGGYPQAQNPPRVLYGIHDGALGTGHPTNRGVDPYLATRGEGGWGTEYVGIPANNPNSTSSFSSTLVEADSGLSTFVFGGPKICSPCFSDGGAGQPVHLPNGELVQGMLGLIPQPAAQPAGYVGRRVSADGIHFVFGSTSQFEPDGNNNGDVSIYDRNLISGQTHVVSKTPGGATMTGAGIGELDISSDGSRILLGRLVSESGGAKSWHLYMNIGGSDQTIDLTPGTTTGARYDGMTADGSQVILTTTDALSTATNPDTDESADVYRSEVSGSSATLTRISTGTEGAGDTDSCDPAANTVRTHWNTPASKADCGVVAVGGGGGVAAKSGTAYFLSPEKLDGSARGVQDAPNLYLARTGQAPHFVVTLESSANAPLPEPTHPFIRSFASMINPTGIAVDALAGDVYVLEVKHEDGFFNAEVLKFNQAANLVDNFGFHGHLRSIPPSFDYEFNERGSKSLPTQLAVDNDPASPSYRDLYVPDINRGAVDKFGPRGEGKLRISVDEPTGVAVDPSNGRVYVSSLAGEVHTFDPLGNPIASFPTISHATGLAVGSGGTVYVVSGTATTIYDSAGNQTGTLTNSPSFGVAVDPSTDHVYVNEGGRVIEFDASGNQVHKPFGSEVLEGGTSIATYGDELYVTNSVPGNVAVFGPPAVIEPEADSPLVIDSISSPSTRHAADFQITAEGNDAIFTSVLPLTGYDNAVHREVFRYDTQENEVSCVSCNPTSQQATGDASLSDIGSGLTEDGRVFFDSTEGLVDRDNNDKNKDVYQWEPQGGGVAPAVCHAPNGCVELVSAGTSLYDSSLLAVSASGTDAYFFTRDRLVEQDVNGNTVKIYDARSFGGFPFVPAPVQCKASDECHGASTQAPPPPEIRTLAPTVFEPGPPAQCKSGFTKKHGKCVRKKCKVSFTKRHGKCVRNNPKRSARHRYPHREGTASHHSGGER